MTVDLLESDQDAARLVQSQKTWISIDEYQDTNRLQERLLELWIGESTPRSATCSGLGTLQRRSSGGFL